jgi:small conductance mechanosensitive channel
MNGALEPLVHWAKGPGLRILAIVLAALVVVFLSHRVTGRLVRRAEKEPLRQRERLQRAETIRRVLDKAVSIVVGAVAGTMVLRELGVDIAPLLAGVGVVGVAVGFGAQVLIRDLLAGLFILLEDQFALGDTIAVGGVSGTVEHMSLRATVLRDLDGTLHVVPNGEMRVVSNRSRGWSQLLLRVAVPYTTDLERATQILQRVAEELAADPAWQGHGLEGPSVAGVEELRANDIALLVTAKTSPGEQWAVARELRRRIVEAFGREGIELPAPTRIEVTRVLREERPTGQA